ncbi:hypothetical protein [Brucella intermedia]|uniref:hypothetical protein n=1 Tax=Brucella intermedia TaxID=94625 RepID=UPI00165D18D3|nr:hypothetical protein [Brucella intermedia]QNQ43073.1 hypothetical protein IAR37_16630 [Brucella intermedia]
MSINKGGDTFDRMPIRNIEVLAEIGALLDEVTMRRIANLSNTESRQYWVCTQKPNLSRPLNALVKCRLLDAKRSGSFNQRTVLAVSLGTPQEFFV